MVKDEIAWKRWRSLSAAGCLHQGWDARALTLCSQGKRVPEVPHTRHKPLGLLQAETRAERCARRGASSAQGDQPLTGESSNSSSRCTGNKEPRGSVN